MSEIFASKRVSTAECSRHLQISSGLSPKARLKLRLTWLFNRSPKSRSLPSCSNTRVLPVVIYRRFELESPAGGFSRSCYNLPSRRTRYFYPSSSSLRYESYQSWAWPILSIGLVSLSSPSSVLSKTRLCADYLLWCYY
ncbi:unnamed protein product [Arabis nemorensis]|uniref:Uncharacterized protein n=1 Tax=Arabis nemorensis TaxID=586526 RepID=A0A565CCL5_9BRAS|nr:unnamed protein product [Arabis nemorensis]